MPHLVKFRTATMVSRVDNSLAGSFMYFADADDALDTGLFCEKIVVWWESEYPFGDMETDVKGKYFRVATKEEIKRFCK